MFTNTQKQSYNVLFISYMNWDSLMEMPALLADGGCTVDVFCTEKSWVLENKYYRNSIIAHSTNEKEFVAELLAYVGKHYFEYQWIIPGDDGIIRLLNDSILSEELFYKIMPLTKIENRSLLGSKAGFSEMCTRYNIKTPKYLVYDELLSAEEIGAQIGFPMMVKADRSEGGFGIYKCNSELELEVLMKGMDDKTNMVFQQYIAGHEVNTELLCKNGHLITYNYSRRLKTIGQFGVSTQRIYTNNTDLEIELRHIADSLGLNGFCNVVFMYSEKDGVYYLIEVDVRPNSWMYYGKFTGNNFSEGVRRIAQGNYKLMSRKRGPKKEVFVALYKKDIYRCLVEKDFLELLKWCANWNFRWKYIPFYDSGVLKATNKFLSFYYKKFFIEKAEREFHTFIAQTKNILTAVCRIYQH